MAAFLHKAREIASLDLVLDLPPIAGDSLQPSFSRRGTGEALPNRTENSMKNNTATVEDQTQKAQAQVVKGKTPKAKREPAAKAVKADADSGPEAEARRPTVAWIFSCGARGSV